ncbi:MAG: hypothetical protein AAF490_19900 [Chloroflexota bacterium]
MNDKKELENKLPQKLDKTFDIEAYIESLNLKDIGSWTKKAQAAYVRARLKARLEGKTYESSHWDLF